MIRAATSGSPGGKFEFGEVVSTARGLIKGSKRVLFLWALLATIVGGVLGFFFGPDPLEPRLAQVLVLDLVMSVMAGVTLVAVSTAGLVRAAGERLSFKALLRHMDRLPQVLLVMVPGSFVSTYLPQLVGGWVWFVLVVLWLPAALWAYYVIDSGDNAFEAVVASYRVVLDNLGAYLKYSLLVFALLAPSLALALLGAVGDSPALVMLGRFSCWW